MYYETVTDTQYKKSPEVATLKEDIQNLIELQSIDLKVYKIDEKMNEGFIGIEEKGQEIATNKKSIFDYKEQLELADKRRQELESTISDEQERIKDRQTKLMNIQTNREYQSILKEIEDTKHSNKQNEDELLVLIEQLESMEKKIIEVSQKCADDEATLEAEKKTIKDAATKLETAKKKIIKARTTQAKKVEEKHLRRYETLKERRNGLAVAGVIQGVCQGCNMNIPPQMFNELLREDAILSCPTCNRMMYHKAEVVEEE